MNKSLSAVKTILKTILIELSIIIEGSLFGLYYQPCLCISCKTKFTCKFCLAQMFVQMFGKIYMEPKVKIMLMSSCKRLFKDCRKCQYHKH